MLAASSVRISSTRRVKRAGVSGRMSVVCPHSAIIVCLAASTLSLISPEVAACWNSIDARRPSLPATQQQLTGVHQSDKYNDAGQKSFTLCEIFLASIVNVDTYSSLGSIVNTNGGTYSEVKIMIGKVRAALLVLNKIWKCRGMSIPTKLRI